MPAFVPMVLCNYCRPQTKLREGNVFTGVCLSTGRRSGHLSSHILSGGYLWYQVPLWGVCPGGGYNQGMGWVCPGWVPPTPGTRTLDTTRYGRQAGGTYPNGLLSCYQNTFVHNLIFSRILVSSQSTSN